MNLIIAALANTGKFRARFEFNAHVDFNWDNEKEDLQVAFVGANDFDGASVRIPLTEDFKKFLILGTSGVCKAHLSREGRLLRFSGDCSGVKHFGSFFDAFHDSLSEVHFEGNCVIQHRN